MIQIALSLLVLVAEPQPAFRSVDHAVESVARAENADAAILRIKAAGKPGLWALCEAVKKKEGEERARLYEAIGRFGGDDAQWALTVGLKNSDPVEKAGALRGLGWLRDSRTFGMLTRNASSNEEIIRNAVVDAMVLLKEDGAKLFESLLSNEDAPAREVAYRYVLQSGNSALWREMIPRALKDPSPIVQRQGLMLVQTSKDSSEIFSVTDLARGANTEVALFAIDVISELGGWNASSELLRVITDERTAEAAWQKAAALLRKDDESGSSLFVDAIARTQDVVKQNELVSVFVESVQDSELGQIVDLLDDPSDERSRAARMILEQTGEAGMRAATERFDSALPELQAAIQTFLASRAKQKGGASTASASAK